jgi:hypothetical protein
MAAMAKDSLGLEFISYIPSLNLKIVVKKATNRQETLRCVITDWQSKWGHMGPIYLIRQEIASRCTSSQVRSQRFLNTPEHGM